jgi:hypothetical protein
MYTPDYREGDRVRINADGPDIPAGTIGTIVAIYRTHGRVTRLDVQVDGRDCDTAYITLYPYELEWL